MFDVDQAAGMLPFETLLPYDIIGFVVFWGCAVVAVRFGLMIGRALLIRGLTWVVNVLWAGKNPSEGETPDGWRHPAAFYVHILLKLAEFRKPLAWRWRTYKQEHLDGD